MNPIRNLYEATLRQGISPSDWTIAVVAESLHEALDYATQRVAEINAARRERVKGNEGYPIMELVGVAEKQTNIWVA